jgi:hypothetical protein
VINKITNDFEPELSKTLLRESEPALGKQEKKDPKTLDKP